MKSIVIIGAGAIGGSVAEALAVDHRVTVIDADSERMGRLRDRMDARFIVGMADSPELLGRAGVGDADIVLTVTKSDLTNLAVSRICRTLFDEHDAVCRIARIRNRDISRDRRLLEDFGVTIPYDPEDIIASSISGAVHHPGTSKMLEVCEGVVRAAIVDIEKGNRWVGRMPTEIRAKDSDINFLIGAVFRSSKAMPCDPNKKIEAGDELLVIAHTDDLFSAVRLLCEDEEETSRVFIAGGGHIGRTLAEKLERHFAVTLVEPDPTRCAILSQELGKTLVLEADPTDSSALRAEDVESSHYFCAVTESDEINIMSALLAKQLGCLHAAVLANQYSFQRVLRSHGMDMVVSPSEITSGILQRELQVRSYLEVHQIGESGASLTELRVGRGAPIVHRNFAQVEWPDNVVPCALARTTRGSKPDEAHPLLGMQSGEVQLFDSHDSSVTIEVNDILLLYIRDGNLDTLQALADKPADHF